MEWEDPSSRVCAQGSFWANDGCDDDTEQKESPLTAGLPEAGAVHGPPHVLLGSLRGVNHSWQSSRPVSPHLRVALWRCPARHVFSPSSPTQQGVMLGPGHRVNSRAPGPVLRGAPLRGSML